MAPNRDKGTADGKKLRRVATGFWNPFGAGRDIFGRLFAVDNDPDAMPPCRMVHVVEGGEVVGTATNFRHWPRLVVDGCSGEPEAT